MDPLKLETSRAVAMGWGGDSHKSQPHVTFPLGTNSGFLRPQPAHIKVGVGDCSGPGKDLSALPLTCSSFLQLSSLQSKKR